MDGARHQLAENRVLLDGIWRRYNVEPRFIVALWGIESDFGKVMGNYAVVSALATLAYDGRRSSYFRSELISALRILDQGHIRADNMTGSWAGAMGQCQFMPSTFLGYAVDYDGDGRQRHLERPRRCAGLDRQFHLAPGLARRRELGAGGHAAGRFRC